MKYASLLSGAFLGSLESFLNMTFSIKLAITKTLIYAYKNFTCNGEPTT